ncbi:MAG: glycosyltransferase family 2 protein [Thermoanaerobaculia bacterium]
MANVPKVAAIVLNYNGKDVTLQALASLVAMTYPEFDVVVADNGSTDGSGEAVADAFPGVFQVRTEDNLGPAGGLNLGIRWAMERDYDHLLILNNDIEAAPDMLTELVAVAESDPAIGTVQPKAYYYWDRERIWSAGGEIRFREAITSERGEGETDRGQYDRDVEVDYTCGCAMLVKRTAVSAAGLMDPMYHLCVEDADFCVRVKRRGFRCFYAHRAKLWHMVSTSTGGYVPGKTFHSARSTAIFVRRHANPWQWITALTFIAASLPLAFVRELVKGNQAAVTAKARGFADGFRVALSPPPRGLEPEGTGRAG